MVSLSSFVALGSSWSFRCWTAVLILRTSSCSTTTCSMTTECSLFTFANLERCAAGGDCDDIVPVNCARANIRRAAVTPRRRGRRPRRCRQRLARAAAGRAAWAGASASSSTLRCATARRRRASAQRVPAPQAPPDADPGRTRSAEARKFFRRELSAFIVRRAEITA